MRGRGARLSAAGEVAGEPVLEAQGVEGGEEGFSRLAAGAPGAGVLPQGEREEGAAVAAVDAELGQEARTASRAPGARGLSRVEIQ
jgi:hypothetical protein